MLQALNDWKAAYGSEEPGGNTTPIGNIFTHLVTIPPPNPAQCSLPVGLGGQVNGNPCWTKLRFPVSQYWPSNSVPPALIRAWFEVDFAYGNYTTPNGVASYVIRNPRVVSPDGPVFIQDVKFFLNGIYRENYGEAYRQVDTVVDAASFGTGCSVPGATNPLVPFDPNTIGSGCVPSTSPLFSTSPSSSGILQERDPELGIRDQISFSFVYFQPGVVGDCLDIGMWQQQIFTPISLGAVQCLNCHQASGQIPEAGQRFNMNPNDPVNNPLDTVTGLPIYNEAQRLMRVCKKFLQRSTLHSPANSPIIVQPFQGMNGMPPQVGFTSFAPYWIDWIERERDLRQ